MVTAKKVWSSVYACTVIAGIRLPGVLAQSRNIGSLTDECDATGSSADYSEALSGTGTTMVRDAASATGCPNHVNWAINPNVAREISSDESIPAYPMLQADDGTTSLAEAAGAVGILFNGVSLFSSWAADEAVSYQTAALYLEGDTFDPCGGHATSTGWYHYHNTAGCLQEQAMAAAGTTTEEHSPQLGWSYDGFPVYGQLGPSGVEMLVCGNEGADAEYCLDLCNGYEGELSGVDDFSYRYYLSCGFDEAFFPFTTNCYRGCCPTGVTCNRHVEECGSSATDGYTSDYVPVAAASLAETYDADLIDGDDTDLIDSDTSLDCSLYLGSAAVSDTDSGDDTGDGTGDDSGGSSSAREATRPKPWNLPVSAAAAVAAVAVASWFV